MTTSNANLRPVFHLLALIIAACSWQALAQDSTPTADAGDHRLAYVGETVVLDGGANSIWKEQQGLFVWSFVDIPAGSNSVLYAADTETPFFFVDREGAYVVELLVRDGDRKSSPSQVVISAPRQSSKRLDLAALSRGEIFRGGLDTDGDGVADAADNCIEQPNTDQRDTDGDLFGNICDADLNNDGVVNAVDLGFIKLAFFGTPVSANWNPDADFNGDDIVNVIDLGIMKLRFFGTPGPSGLLPDIFCGDLLTGTIDESGDGDFYRIALTAGQVVELTVGQTIGFAGSVARGTLFNPDGSAVLTVTAQDQQLYTAAQTGIYQVVMRAANGLATGDYGVGLNCINPALPVAANLTCGDLISDTITATGEADLYTFDAQAGDRLLINIGQSSGFAGSVARAFVYAPDGQFLATYTAQDQGVFDAPVSGAYVIKVAAANFFATGNYSIGISCVNPVDSQATMLNCGDLETSTISAVGEADLYTFGASAGDQLLITIGQSFDFAGSLARAFVYAPDGQFLGSYTAQDQGLFSAPASGTYVIKVSAANFFATGTYSVGISCLLPVDPLAVPLSCGDLETSTIAANGEADLYTFDADAGDELLVTIGQSAGFAGSLARAFVYAPDGQFLGTYTAQAQGQFSASQSGTYVLKVSAANFFATGTYSVGINCLSPIDPQATAFNCGVPLASTIMAPGEADLYTMDAQAGDVLTMTVAVESGFAGSVPRAQLFSEVGQLLATYTAQAQELYTVPATETYVLKVAAANFFATGNYSIARVCILPTEPVEAVISCGATQSSSIGAVAESDLYTFNATSGDDLTINLTQTAGFAGSVVRVRLFSPAGEQIATYTGNSANAFTPTESGTFILRVSAANIHATGSYDLGLACN